MKRLRDGEAWDSRLSSSIALEESCAGGKSEQVVCRLFNLMNAFKRPIPARRVSPKLPDAHQRFFAFRFYEAAVRELRQSASCSQCGLGTHRRQRTRSGPRYSWKNMILNGRCTLGSCQLLARHSQKSATTGDGYENLFTGSLV